MRAALFLLSCFLSRADAPRSARSAAQGVRGEEGGAYGCVREGGVGVYVARGDLFRAFGEWVRGRLKVGGEGLCATREL